MADTNLDIQVNDSQVEQLVSAVNNLVDSLGKLERESNSAARAVDNVGDESSQAARKVDDLDGASNRSSSSLLSLGGSASSFGRSLGSMTAAVAVGIVAIAGLDSIGAALQTTFDFAKDSIEGLTESGRAMAKELQTVSASFRGARLNLAELILEAIGGEQAISDLNFVAFELSNTLSELKDEFGNNQSIIIPLTQTIINFAAAAATAFDIANNVANALILVGEGAIFTASAFVALLGPPGQALQSIGRATERLERRFNELSESTQGAAEIARVLRGAARDLNTTLGEGSDQTRDYANSVRTLREQFGLLGQLMTGQSSLSGGGSSGGGGGMPSPIELSASLNIAQNIRRDTDLLSDEWTEIILRSKNLESMEVEIVSMTQARIAKLSRAYGMARSAIDAVDREVDIETIIGFLDPFFDLTVFEEAILREDPSQLESILEQKYTELRGVLVDGFDTFISEAQADESARRFKLQLLEDLEPEISSEFFPKVTKAYQGAVDQINAYFDTMVSAAQLVGANEESILRIEQLRNRELESASESFAEQNREARRLQQTMAEMVKDKPMPTPDLSGFNNQVLSNIPGLDLDGQRSQIKTVEEAWDSLSRAQQAYAKNAGMSISDINTALNEQREAVKQAFRTEAIDGFSETLGGFAEYAGQALAGVVDQQLSAGEKAKKLIGTFFGDFLKTIGTTAIAQGAIISIADPASGGFPKPAKGAALIAAGIAATVAGAAISGKAGAIGQKKDKQPTTTAASTPGGGGGGGTSTTNVFISNQFGNRFDARELDRSAAQTFASAASQGQI